MYQTDIHKMRLEVYKLNQQAILAKLYDLPKVGELLAGLKTDAKSTIDEMLFSQKEIFNKLDLVAEKKADYLELLKKQKNYQLLEDQKNEKLNALDPQTEVETLKNRGQLALKSLNIDYDAEVQPMDYDADNNRRLLSAISKPKFRTAMLKCYYQNEVDDAISKLKLMTYAEALSSGLLGQAALNLIKREQRGENENLSVISKPLTDFVNKLINDSSISKSEALSFAQSINVDNSAKNALKQSNFYRGKKGLENLQNDIADLYRLTNGKFNLKTLTKVKRNERAHFSNHSKTINVGSALEKPTLWHELTHSLEYDNPKLLVAVKGFLKERLKIAESKSSGIKPLSKIYPRNGYRANEVAIEDSAFSHYVTKLYCKNGFKQDIDHIYASEVLTMGIECLSNPSLSAKLLKTDPDHAAFVIGALLSLRD